MALEYLYDAETGLVSIIGRGNVSVDERISLVRRMLDDRDLPESASVLIDIGAVTNGPNAEDMPVIGLLIERLLARFRCRVAVVNATVGHLTLSHLVAFSVAGGRECVRVFADSQEARHWLQSSEDCCAVEG